MEQERTPRPPASHYFTPVSPLFPLFCFDFVPLSFFLSTSFTAFAASVAAATFATSAASAASASASIALFDLFLFRLVG
ncbi:hypothetical protein FRC12_003381 [Ceratobasidium sp. 428]|nr:hypothetical protein FRC12_003381 [Ceratobasidium sp. 428]